MSSRRRVVVPSGAFSTASHGKTICSVHGQLVPTGRYLLVRPWAGLVASLRTFSSQGLAVAYPLLGICGPGWIGPFGRPERFFFEGLAKASSSVDGPWVATLSWATGISFCFLNQSAVLSSSSCI